MAICVETKWRSVGTNRTEVKWSEQAVKQIAKEIYDSLPDT